VNLYTRISAIQGELANGALSPDLARESLVKLTALLGNVNDLVRKTDHEYKLVLLGAMKGHKAASRARIEAETSTQYQLAREAQDTADLVIEMIRSLKKYMESLSNEIRLARG
jgi:Mg2+ and Co2+ transporter CorA